MAASDDKVVYQDAFLAARDAVKAMADYKIGIVGETAGKGKAIHAIIEYGKALLRGRNQDRSNISFQMWVSENKLDVGEPWSNRKEREKAMSLAEIFVGGSVPPSKTSVPPSKFDACPYTRPTDIMKWYRKTYGPIAPKRPSLASQIDTAYQTILDWKQLGKEIPSDLRDFARQIGVSHRASYEAAQRWRQERKPAEPIIEPKVAEPVITEPAITPAAEAHFSEKSKLRIDDAIRIHQARLEKTFQTRVGEEVRRHIEAADEAMRKQNAQLRKENLAVNMLLQQGAVFSVDEFKTIRRCVHPDNSASTETRARAFDLINQKEERLTGIAKRKG